MNGKFLRVAKVGGSLFSFAELPSALRSWLDNQPGANVLIAGGGPFTDAVRRADETFAIGDATAHRLALETMRVAGQLLAVLLPEAEIVHSLADARTRIADRGNTILDPCNVIQRPECQLPASWDVTSDSIAAYIASELGAHELVLFKSRPLPANTVRSEAAEAGLVDRCFSHAAARFPMVRWVNLRGEPVTERPF